MIHRLAAFAFAVTALVMPAPVGRADVIFDNLSQPSGGGDYVKPGSGVQGPLYDSFSTGTGAGFLLTDVQLLLFNAGINAGSTSIGIYDTRTLSGGAVVPGDLVATIGTVSDSSLSGTASVWNVSVASPVSLAAGTRYWAGLSTSDNANAQWSFTSTNAGTGVAGEYLSNNLGTFPTSEITGPYQMAVSVTAVPEPVGCAMLLASLACGGLSMRPRRKR
ncbi:MAG: choice-of-anchor R domain-containing protein [Planctomycetaceae bacterium]